MSLLDDDDGLFIGLLKNNGIAVVGMNELLLVVAILAMLVAIVVVDGITASVRGQFLITHCDET
jgi:hypothetical protein